MHESFKVLDSDIHIIEPPDLWQRYIDPTFRDRSPHGLTEDVGDLRLAHAGEPWGRVAGTDADTVETASHSLRPTSNSVSTIRCPFE